MLSKLTQSGPNKYTYGLKGKAGSSDTGLIPFILFHDLNVYQKFKQKIAFVFCVRNFWIHIGSETRSEA